MSYLCWSSAWLGWTVPVCNKDNSDFSCTTKFSKNSSSWTQKNWGKQVLSYDHRITRAIFTDVRRKILTLHDQLDDITGTHMVEKFAVFGCPSYLHHSWSNDCNFIVPDSRIDTERASYTFKGRGITSCLPKPNRNSLSPKLASKQTPFFPGSSFLPVKIYQHNFGGISDKVTSLYSSSCHTN